ncbi:putative MFS family arabinose efflux permease [Kribbella steppae]|uniref:Putative MFS family arabinose efflux permease n=1 Tax=Kribbella steppae TaxID=2512223 RepID=A0A4R2H3U7_9ACTN|nr:MFS transporter [Kribbella steppae]TCO20274.1 putative MFS family arabinose efflux permease [Kribbella steppae]
MTTSGNVQPAPGPIRSSVPARLDRLPWTRFHWRVVIALGITWVLDGVEITIAGTIADRLRDQDSLAFSSSQVGLAASLYLLGEVFGALVFGRLTDKLGRRKLFIATLGVYLLGNTLTAFSMNFWFFAATRFIAGAGIGGEYAAINSAIDELIPAKYRGRTDLAVNGTYWLGAMIGAAANLAFLNEDLFGVNLGWRIALLIGPLIGVMIWPLRRHLPESPRWLLTHGRADEAERIVGEIERDAEAKGIELPPVGEDSVIVIRPRGTVNYRELARVVLRDYRRRSLVGLTLMVTQAFLYNAIFFTYALILADFYGIQGGAVAYFIFPFALGNLLGPILLGRYFDTIGRRVMVGGTYALSGLLLFVTGWLFNDGALTAITQTILWCVIFFFASAAASSAYLTVSEIFPIELRAQAISFFFALAVLVGGVVAPWLFATLIGDGEDRGGVFLGYTFASILMIIGGLVEFVWGVNAERRSLEAVATPLSARAATAAAESGLTGGLTAHVRRGP